MNVDEAMEIAGSSNKASEWYDGSLIEAVGVLRKEVERLRAELTFREQEVICVRNSQSLELANCKEDNERLRAELAAAKAASVCPVEISALGDADWEYSVCVRCKSDDDANKLFDWLWERLEERVEG